MTRETFSAFCLLLFLSALSCSCKTEAEKSNGEATQTIDSGSVRITNDTLCYLRTEGNNLQDSSFIQLVISNGKVKGIMKWIPYEKDARIGSLNGIKTGDSLSLTWTYMQEGMKDSLPVFLRIQHGKLFQKESSVDAQSGREVVMDTARFSVEYDAVPCNR